MTIKVGDTFTSNNFGRYRVGILDGEYAWIVFENTGNVEHPSIRMIVANGIVDYKADYTIRVGHLYNTSNHGQVKVLQALDSRNIKVKFVNTGYEMTAQKHAVLAGLLTDKAAVVMEAESKRKEKDRKEEERKAATQAERRAREDAIAIQKERTRIEKQLEKEAAREAKKILGSDGKVFLGTIHIDKLNFKFQVLGRIDLSSKWEIKYLESGNTYIVSESNIRRQRVNDTQLPNFFALQAAYFKEMSANYYEANRESIIKKNSEYQKNNLDKARVRNQKRRATRLGENNHHTLEDVQFIMEMQDHKCACCGTSLDDSNKHLDHRIPLSLGGSNGLENLQWLCKFCNLCKSDTPPDEWETYSNSEHFKNRLEYRRLSLQ